jgi:hypothetical protein
LLLIATAAVWHVSHNVTVLKIYSNPEMNFITMQTNVGGWGAGEGGGN